MIYRNENVSRNDYRFARFIYNYLNNYIDGLTLESSEVIDFWGKFKLRFTDDQRYLRIWLQKNNSNEYDLGSSDCTYPNTSNIVLIYTEDFLYFNMASTSTGGGCSIIYLKDKNDNEYAGGTGAPIGVNQSILYNNVTMYNIGDEESVFNFIKMIGFEMPTGEIAFTDKAPLAISGNLSFFAKDLVSCSNVPVRNVITMRGHNYLAVDTNTLIQLDD